MKKIFGLLLISVFILTGCGTSMNTPTAAVETYLKKYQNMDSEIMTQLDSVISGDSTMSDEQKKEYKNVIINQYKNLSYKIKDETITNDEARVEVEIEVLDYATSISEARNYYRNHLEEFEEKDKNDNKDEENDVVGGVAGDAIDAVEDKIDQISTFIDYKIKKLKDVEDKTSYDITFYLTKENDKWEVDELNDSDIEKLHGLFEG